MRIIKDRTRHNHADLCADLYRSIKEKYGPLLVRIRKRIADASIISHPDNPFHPTDYCVPKAVVMKKGNSLHRIGPCEREDDRLAVTRRELVGWPGLQVPEVTNDENGGLPEMLRYGERTIRDIDHSLIAQAIREEAILSKYPLPTLVIGFALWSDSCDPNRSMSKLNRGSIWALLLTLCCRIANINPFSYTYLIALGKDVSCSKQASILKSKDWLNLTKHTVCCRVRITTRC